MNYIYIGKYVNTHGIKGEIRILSDFEFKDKIFKKGFTIYIGSEKLPMTINTYRIHKNYDMLTFDEIKDINNIEKYKGMNVYAIKEQIETSEIFNEDYIGMDVIMDREIGKVVDIVKSKAYDLLVINNNKKKNYIPKIDEFIEKIDVENNKIYIRKIEGLIDED